MKKRGRHSNPTPSVRMRLGEGNIQLGQDKDIDALYRRIQGLPRGTRFRTVCAWLITGAKMESHLPQEELDEIKQAAEDIIANFVV